MPQGKGKTGYAHTMYRIDAKELEEDGYPVLHTDKVCIGNIDYKKHPKIGFVFDFGDDHRFIIEYKGKRKETEGGDFISFPHLVDQRGVAPP